MFDFKKILEKTRIPDDDFERERFLRQKEQSQKKKNIETEEAIRQALQMLDGESLNNLIGENSNHGAQMLLSQMSAEPEMSEEMASAFGKSRNSLISRLSSLLGNQE